MSNEEKTSTKQFNALFEQEIRIHRKGTHTMVPPRAEGLYPIWARDGSFRGFVEVVHEGRAFTPIYYFRGRRAVRPADLHVGWWWSKPFPPLPSAPEWDAMFSEVVEADSDNDNDGDDLDDEDDDLDEVRCG